MDVVVTSTLGLVEDLLASTLALVGLQAAGNTIGSVGGSLVNLILGGLGGVRCELLLSL